MMMMMIKVYSLAEDAFTNPKKGRGENIHRSVATGQALIRFLHYYFRPFVLCAVLQLNQVHLGEIGRAAPVHDAALAIQARILVADPDMLAQLLGPQDFVVADAELVPRDPDHRPPRPERLMLERAPHELIALFRSQVFDLVIKAREERFPDSIATGLLSFKVGGWATVLVLAAVTSFIVGIAVFRGIVGFLVPRTICPTSLRRN